MSSTLIDTWCTASGSTTRRLGRGRPGRVLVSGGQPLLLASEDDLLRVAQQIGDGTVRHERDAPPEDREHEPRITGAGQCPDHDKGQVRSHVDSQVEQEDPAAHYLPAL